MTKLEYSIGASNVINRFYGVEAMVYVEGDYDVPFWECLFEQLSEIRVKVQHVGGKPELLKYAHDVFMGKLNAVVAMDSDYSIFGIHIEHNNIIKTFGHSIENTIVCPITIRDVIRSIGRIPSRDIPLELCQDWLELLSTEAELLVAYDVENDRQGHGIKVLPDHCMKFLTGRKTPSLCRHKIESHVKSLGFVLGAKDVAFVKLVIHASDAILVDYIRGHFLFSAAQTFACCHIRKFRNKLSISTESFFGALMLAFASRFNESHRHHAWYESRLRRISLS